LYVLGQGGDRGLTKTHTSVLSRTSLRGKTGFRARENNVKAFQNRPRNAGRGAGIPVSLTVGDSVYLSKRACGAENLVGAQKKTRRLREMPGITGERKLWGTTLVGGWRLRRTVLPGVASNGEQRGEKHLEFCSLAGSAKCRLQHGLIKTNGEIILCAQVPPFRDGPVFGSWRR